MCFPDIDLVFKDESVFHLELTNLIENTKTPIILTVSNSFDLKENFFTAKEIPFEFLDLDSLI